MILDILNSAVEDSLYRYKQYKCLDNNVDCPQELLGKLLQVQQGN
jgi:hypothetical protein